MSSENPLLDTSSAPENFPPTDISPSTDTKTPTDIILSTDIISSTDTIPSTFNLKKEYTNFLVFLKQIFPTVNIEIYESDPITRIQKFNDLMKSQTLFNYFLKSKIKLFSHKETNTHKISESIFGEEFSLKKIFNNQEDAIKLVLWRFLHNLVKYYNEELIISPDIQSKIDKINACLVNQDCSNSTNSKGMNIKDSLNKILKTDSLNEDTNGLINDIIQGFESSMSNQTNPFENIMKISNIITDKYKDKIESGDIKIDDIFKNMQSLPGMEAMGPMMNSLFTNMGAEPENEEKVIIDENFSTSMVEVPEPKVEAESSMSLKNILKTADNFGLMDSLGGNVSNDAAGMSKIMNIFNKLTTQTDPDEIQNVFQKELGIDMDKLTTEMGKILAKPQ